jgi:nucleotide-binding universal stress UspA family protein
MSTGNPAGGTVLPRLGSTTHGVLHRATQPVLVVPIHT